MQLNTTMYSNKSWQNKILNTVTIPDINICDFSTMKNDIIKNTYFIMIQTRICGFNKYGKKKVIKKSPKIITSGNELYRYLNLIATKDYSDEFTIRCYDGFTVYPSFRILVINKNGNMKSYESLNTFLSDLKIKLYK